MNINIIAEIMALFNNGRLRSPLRTGLGSIVPNFKVILKIPNPQRRCACGETALFFRPVFLVPTKISAAHYPDLAGAFLVGKNAGGEGRAPTKLK